MTVSLEKYSHEEISRMSLIELAKLMMLDEKDVIDFQDIFRRVANLKGLSEEERQARIGQFYTDINMDGSFITKGSNKWGLKRWYRMDQANVEKETPAILKIRRRVRKLRETEEFDFSLNEFNMIDANIDIIDDDYEEEIDMDFDDGFEVDDEE